MREREREREERRGKYISLDVCVIKFFKYFLKYKIYLLNKKNMYDTHFYLKEKN